MSKRPRGKVNRTKRKPKKAPRPAARDDFGEKLLKRKGSIDPDVVLEFLVGAGIPEPSKGGLPWASKGDIASFLDRPHMLTAEGLAAQLHVSRETVRQWQKAGKAIGVRGAKRDLRFPAWQASGRGQIYPAIERILRELDGDHWAAWLFLEERVPELGAIGFQALAAGKEDALLKALIGRSYGSFS